MDILDMNVLDETENDNGIPAEDNDDDDEGVNFQTDEEHGLLSEGEERVPEVRRQTWILS